MGLIDRLAGEPDYDGMPEPEPVTETDLGWQPARLQQDPNDPSHWSYTSPAPPPVLHQWVSAEPKLRVRLESHGDPKTDRFYHSWEISFEGTAANEVLAKLQLVDDHLQARYGGLP